MIGVRQVVENLDMHIFRNVGMALLVSGFFYGSLLWWMNVRREQSQQHPLRPMVRCFLLVHAASLSFGRCIYSEPISIVKNTLLFCFLVWPYRFVSEKMPKSSFQIHCQNVLFKLAGLVHAYQTYKSKQARDAMWIFESSTAGDGDDDDDSVSWSLVAYLFVIGPIKEEVIFRLFLFSLLKALLRPHCSQAITLLCGYTPWAVVSSLLFALLHVTNHGGSLRNGLVLEEGEKHCNAAMFDMATAVFQTTLAFLLSLRILTPMFEKHGLAASIGAHCAWNTIFGPVAAVFWSVLEVFFEGNDDAEEDSGEDEIG